MANDSVSATYILQALRKLNAATSAVQAARANPSLSADQYSALTRSYFALDELHDKLLAEDINSQIDQINLDAQKLQQIIAALQGAQEQLQSVIEAVNTVAQVIGTVTQIVKLGATIS